MVKIGIDIVDVAKPDRDLGEVKPNEWNKALASYKEEWKSFLKANKGKRFCGHSWGDPTRIELPPTSLEAKIIYSNGATKEGYVTAYGSNNEFSLNFIPWNTNRIRQCVKCGKIDFYLDPYQKLMS